MPHHYLEEQEDETDGVKFQATIQPPKMLEPPCCAAPTPYEARHNDDLSDVIPTILVGIGVAYAVGLVTGAWIFSTPVVE